MDISNYTFNSLTHYFNVLENTGYVKDQEVFNLLLLSFYDDFLSEYIITEDDYNEIMKALNCIYGESCSISYPVYIIQRKAKYKAKNLRISEDQATRIANNNIRIQTQL